MTQKDEKTTTEYAGSVQQDLFHDFNDSEKDEKTATFVPLIVHYLYLSTLIESQQTLLMKLCSGDLNKNICIPCLGVSHATMTLIVFMYSNCYLASNNFNHMKLRFKRLKVQ